MIFQMTMRGLRFQFLFAQETDGRHIAEVIGLPGVSVYGATQGEAKKSATVLALRVIADQIEHGETEPMDFLMLDSIDG